MKTLPALALALLFPAVALAETGSPGCKAPVETTATDAHSHCGMSAAASSPSAVYSATGSISRVDAAGGSVMIAHDPIEALKWPAMTMRFGADKAVIKKLTPGKKVKFQFVQRGDEYVVTALN